MVSKESFSALAFAAQDGVPTPFTPSNDERIAVPVAIFGDGDAWKIGPPRYEVPDTLVPHDTPSPAFQEACERILYDPDTQHPIKKPRPTYPVRGRSQQVARRVAPYRPTNQQLL